MFACSGLLPTKTKKSWKGKQHLVFNVPAGGEIKRPPESSLSETPRIQQTFRDMIVTSSCYPALLLLLSEGPRGPRRRCGSAHGALVAPVFPLQRARVTFDGLDSVARRNSLNRRPESGPLLSLTPVQIQTAAFIHQIQCVCVCVCAGCIMAYLQARSLANTCTHFERIRSDVFILSERVMHSSGMGRCVLSSYY